MEEFALNDYQSASLSNIVKKLELAKGSFYRYFESKRSLYSFLLDYCVQLRIENDRQLIQDPPNDFFELILLHFKAKVQFDRNHPLASAFLYNVLNEKNSEELGNIRFIRKQKALEITGKIVVQFVASGQIRKDIDPEIIAWNVINTQISILDFLEHKFQLDLRSKIKAREVLYDLPEEEIMAAARQFIEFQRNGLQTHGNH
ncbi:MAG: TetR/AcrR family transcriptional regulator [Bacteroidia bacterium]|nr:TetR/AcrR family transcriptional regulator [Bacteroidia bacterium]